MWTPRPLRTEIVPSEFGDLEVRELGADQMHLYAMHTGRYEGQGSQLLIAFCTYLDGLLMFCGPSCLTPPPPNDGPHPLDQVIERFRELPGSVYLDLVNAVNRVNSSRDPALPKN